MPGPSDPLPSSPLSVALSPSGSKEETIAYYKSQYEALERELADFQASSRALEAEMEKETEDQEKQVRKLKEKNEELSYQVDEWKV